MMLRSFKVLLVATCLALVVAAAAAAGEIEEATASLRRGDHTSALLLYGVLAQRGGAEAQNALGSMYERGEGVLEDKAIAAKWYRLAADQGLPSAQASLGSLHADGTGVPKDYVKAYMWLSLAAMHDAPGAAESRDRVGLKMTASQLGEAQGLARIWRPTNIKPVITRSSH